mmetsp:Transcript_35478/g.101066  ORF Transcript_35478/g.101066 Transcript_35478/m.101066 type:complete len:200 (-) Transcript_35478:243-842(-)
MAARLSTRRPSRSCQHRRYLATRPRGRTSPLPRRSRRRHRTPASTPPPPRSRRAPSSQTRSSGAGAAQRRPRRSRAPRRSAQVDCLMRLAPRASTGHLPGSHGGPWRWPRLGRTWSQRWRAAPSRAGPPLIARSRTRRSWRWGGHGAPRLCGRLGPAGWAPCSAWPCSAARTRRSGPAKGSRRLLLSSASSTRPRPPAA